MPISGYEKPGVKPLARNSSDSVVGVPIKKRRFPFVRFPSPPYQMPASPLEEPDLPQTEKSNSKQETSSNSGGATEVSCAATEKNFFPEKKEENSADKNVNLVQSNVNPRGLDVRESSLTMATGSWVETDSIGKHLLADRSDAFQKIPQNTELQLALNEANAQQIGEDISSKPKLDADDKSKISKTPGNTELLLAPEQFLVPTLAGQNSQGDCQEQEKLDPSLLNLVLSHEQNNVERRNNDPKSIFDGSHPRPNRSNWDLNTMMDTWEGSMNDAATAHGAMGVGGLDAASLDNKKHVIYSTKMVFREREGNSVASGKQIFEVSENRSQLPNLLTPPAQQYKSEDLLHLRLSPSCLQSSFSQEHSGPSTKIISKKVPADLSLLGMVSPISNLNLVGAGIVKSEPFVEGCEQDFKGAKVGSQELVDNRTIKPEQVEANDQESLKSSNMSSLKVADDRPVKSESVHKCIQEALTTAEGRSQQSEHPTCAAEVAKSGDGLHCLADGIRTMAMHITGQVSGPSESLTCGTGLSISGEVSSQSDFPSTKGVHATEEVPQEAREIVERVTSDMVSKSVDPDGKESKITDGMIDAERIRVLDGAITESPILKSMDELHMVSHGNSEVAGSDEEKLNISADIDDSYSTDSESDGDHIEGPAVDMRGKQHGRDDDDYEDGEVREPLVHTATEGAVCEEREAGHVNNGESYDRNTDFSGFPDNDNLAPSSYVEDRDIKIEDPVERKDTHCSGVCDDIMRNENTDEDINKVACLPDTLVVEVPTTGSGKKRPIKNTRRKPLNLSGREDGLKGNETELSSDQALGASQGTATGDGQSEHENAKGTVLVETSNSIFPETEAYVNDNEAVKDVNGRGNRSRIINLAKASNGPSSSRMRSIPARSLPSRAEKEKFSDFVLRGDKLHPRGSRGESYMDGPCKLERERNRGHPVRNSGLEFMHGRRRVGRLDTLRGNWDSDHDFVPDHYNGPTGFRFPRQKNATVRLDCDGYIIAPDGCIAGAGRGERKPLIDELPSFRHLPSRRRSPGGRGRPVTHGVQMVHRPPRDISPDGCIGGGGSDLVGLRHEEKFIRGLPDDMMDSVFSHPQYERVDDPFVHEDRSFSPIQRRGPLHIPRIRSKSPRSRPDAPGPWSSPRRSPDGFDGHPELTHHRSPAIYRIERMRSHHQRTCFPEDMVARRHGSPPYLSRLSNDMREMGSAREHDQPRPFIGNRSPSGRVLPRSTRRFDIIDPRERTESDEYFGERLQSGRFRKLGGVGEREKCSERREPVRSIRPPYNSGDVENFRFNVEDGPRSYIYCPEADTEFHERGSSREREFDRRIKNRPGIAPRRTRSIEEQEENYRHGGQVWHDAGFDDVSRVKRRRF